ncbi:hypothetical protein T06_904 [Trichinella sp. T6]|nr:hypothetical protein T06_904 [Trichinella sp. T6]
MRSELRRQLHGLMFSLHCNIGVAAHFVMLKYIHPYFQNTHKNLLSYKYSVILSSGASRVPNLKGVYYLKSTFWYTLAASTSTD